MKKKVMILIIISFFIKVLGLLRDIALSYYYGASNISDAYIISLTIPMIIFGFIGIGINTTYIPIYNLIIQEKDELRANTFTNNLVNITFLILTFLIVLSLIFTKQFVSIFAVGFDTLTKNISVNLSRVTIFGIYIATLIAVFKSYLQMKGNYKIPVLIGLPLNILMILSIVLSYNTHYMVLAFGYIIANVSQLILIIPYLKKYKYRHRFTFNFNDKYIKRVMYASLPVFISVGINDINVLVDKSIASAISVGGISALNYANRINGLTQGIIITSIIAIVFPEISKLNSTKNIEPLKKYIIEAINIIIIILIPATVGAMIYSSEIIRLMYARGGFDIEAAKLTSGALFYYSIGMIAFGLRDILSRVFYSLNDTKTPMINTSIALVANIFLNIILSKFLGISGLALATSLSVLLSALLLAISLNKKIGFFLNIKTVTTLIKVFLASIMMGVASKFSYNIFSNSLSENISLIMAVMLAIIIYLCLIVLFKVDELDRFFNMIKKRIKR